MIATTFVVYVQENFGWKLGFGVPVICMFLSAISFLLASPLYIKLKAEAGSPVGFTQVFMASWKKRHFNVYESQDDQFLYFRRKGSRLIKPTHKLRYFFVIFLHANDVIFDGIDKMFKLMDVVS